MSDRHCPNAAATVYLPQGADEPQAGEGQTTTIYKSTMSNRMKTLAVGAAMTFVLGGGATAVLLPGFASASVTTHGADDVVGHAGHGADDVAGHPQHAAEHLVVHAKKSVAVAKHGADDTVGEAKHAAVANPSAPLAKHGADDAVGEAKHGADDAVGHV